MDDTINRRAAIDALGEKPFAWGEYEQGLQDQWKCDVDAIKELPSVQPKRKKGEWILKPHEKMLAWDREPFSYDETYNPKHHSVIEMLYHCSTCDYEAGDTKPIWKFCPMCGTDMREVDE